MKNNIRKYIAFGVTTLALTACNDSFLERTPTNDLINVAYWNTVADLEAYTNGIYNEAATNTTYHFMQAFCNSPWNEKLNGPYPCEAMSDNFATVDATQTWASAIAAGIENQPSGTSNYSCWTWTLLRRINVFMENYDKVQAETSDKEPYVGEALFFRAWFYFHLVQYYGDVPLVTKALDTESEELYGTRTPRKEVMKQVLEDINNACRYLPASNWGDNRLTKGAALALKSRIGLYEGTYRKYHNLGDETEFLNACVEASEELMGMDYEIYNTGKTQNTIGNDGKIVFGDYAQLFITDDLSSNKEVIFYRKYEDPLKMHRMCGYTTNIRMGGTKDLIDDYLYLESDGTARPIANTSSYNNDTPEQEFENRDPRLSQTFLTPGTAMAAALFQSGGLADKSFPRLGDMPNWPTPTGYHAIKYYTKEQDVKGFGKETQDCPIFRYAEVLLNYAEAKAELSQCDQTVLDKTINLLRDRVGMPHLTTAPEMDQKYANKGLSALMIEIRRERRVELTFEYLRYHDLMRWAWGDKLKERVLGMRLEDADFSNTRYTTNAETGATITKGGTSGAGANPVYVYVAADGKQYIDVYEGTNYATDKRTFDPAKDYLRPIPSGALSANPNLGQNPYWPGWTGAE